MPQFSLSIPEFDQRAAVEAPDAASAVSQWAKSFVARGNESPALLEDLQVVVTDLDTKTTQLLELEVEYFFEVHVKPVK